MITPMTQVAIAMLNDIYMDADHFQIKEYALSEDAQCILLQKLANAGLICCTDKAKPHLPASYRLLRKSSEISLHDILEATGEHLNCNHPTTEQFYMRYGRAAQKLGVVNQMTRLYLKDIKLFDL